MMASRVSRKYPIEDEVDIRRARGEIACAECRRLKLKCDKKLPCSSCVRRGCSSICPNGSLTTGHGTRVMVADTARLHSKIAEMGKRIRQLEDALTILHSRTSSEPHPLLRSELMAIKTGSEKIHPVEERKPVEDDSADLIDAIGTLTISGHESKYFGRSAGSETLLLVGAEFMTSTGLETGGVDLQTGPEFQLPRIFYCDTEGPPAMTSDLMKMSSTFPFGVPDNTESDMDLLFSFLPHQARAWSLCEVYMEQGSWGFRPIRRDEIVDDILTPVYKALKERIPTKTILQQISVHKLAVLFLVFAIGSVLDMTLEPFNADADRYYHLGRACLAFQNVLDSLELATVQAVLLMAAYHSLCGKKYTMDNTWSLLSFGSKLAQSLGLHRDGARWNMDAKTVDRRRSLFWEMYSTELFYCLALGRPPSIRLSYIDCEYPEDYEATLDANGNILVGFYRWKYEFMKEVIANSVELTLGAKPPSYKTILELDRKVREKTLPVHLNTFMSPEEERFTPSVYMQGCMLGQLRAQTLLYLHKSFFAQAMLDFPNNPLRSPYAPSFLAAYRCASGTIHTCLNHFDRFPDLCCRWWIVWTFLFTAAVGKPHALSLAADVFQVIVGSIVTRSPSSSIASSAFVELGIACDLYENAVAHPPRARSARVILQKLRERACHVYSLLATGIPAAAEFFSSGKPDYGDDELALFGGQTRVLVLRLLGARHSAPSPSSSSPGSDYKDSEVHPSLLEYLSNLAPQYAHYATGSIPQENVTGASGPYMPPSQGILSEQTYQEQNWLPNEQIYSQSQMRSYPEVVPYLEGTINSEAPHVDPLENACRTGGPGMDQWTGFMRGLGLLENNST